MERLFLAGGPICDPGPRHAIFGKAIAAGDGRATALLPNPFAKSSRLLPRAALLVLSCGAIDRIGRVGLRRSGDNKRSGGRRGAMTAIQFDEEAPRWRRREHGARRANAGAAPGLLRLWHGRSVRWQVLATFVLINILAVAATSVIIIFNAKRATEVEIAASIGVAERVVRASIDDLNRAMPDGMLLEDLLRRIGPMRHVRLLVSTATGRPVWLAHSARDATSGKDGEAPAWFAALIHVDHLSRDVPVVSQGQRIGTVLVLGDPRDEIAEVWSDMSGLAILAGMVDLSVILVLYFAFGRVLTPLSALSNGLRQLEQGHFRHRLDEPATQELADLVRRFNALATSLGLARAENISLHRRLFTAEDDERRLIARELHDELGPCLFGLKANMGSLERLADDLPPEKAGRMRGKLAILVGIVDRVQAANRQLLRRLRPAALGEIALADALAALASEFTQHDGAPEITLHTSGLAESYGERIDLTIYRCLQEGLTNALRHARAEHVTATIEASSPPAEDDGGHRLHFALQDDGCGIAADARLGMGLTGMKERVEALGGTFAIATLPSGGTRLSIALASEQ
jgi:two-component system, NarL family, sensor histidine kinase UhpB